MRSFRVACLLIFCINLFGGVKWETTTTSTSKSGKSTIKTNGYAEGDFVRIDYIEVSGKEILYGRGSYWLYNGKNNTISIVDTKEKEYVEIPIDLLSKIMEGMGNIMNIQIKNPKVQVKNLGKETFNGYLCNHYIISSSYETEVSVMIMTVKMKTEETREVWATNEDLFASVFSGFKKSLFKTGFRALDELIDKEMEATKDIGFAVKTISTRKTYDSNNKLTEESKTEMVVSNIVKENIPNTMFTIPKDYKKAEFKLGDYEEIEE